jgi:hypothetical protein
VAKKVFLRDQQDSLDNKSGPSGNAYPKARINRNIYVDFAVFMAYIVHESKAAPGIQSGEYSER